MERKIGDTFEFEGRKLEVRADNCGCVGCFFDTKCLIENMKLCGECEADGRDDGKGVIFVEVQEQQAEEIKERKVGEVFEYQGKKLKVKEIDLECCEGCFFDGKCYSPSKKVAGQCQNEFRTDKKEVIFVEVQEVQELNLCEILKDCPMYEPLWSPMLGDVKLYDINQEAKMVDVELESGDTWDINADGTITFGNVTSQEIMLYPSKEQRDWTKVKYEKKKELPRTWEEFCITHDIKMGEYFIGETGKIFNSNTGKRIPDINKTLLPSEEAAKAHLALMQLHQLRDAWREGWLPDWKDENQRKYVVYNPEGEFTIGYFTITRRFLAFQDEKRADEFKDCFIDLIKQAGDLI